MVRRRDPLYGKAPWGPRRRPPALSPLCADQRWQVGQYAGMPRVQRDACLLPRPAPREEGREARCAGEGSQAGAPSRRRCPHSPPRSRGLGAGVAGEQGGGRGPRTQDCGWEGGGAPGLVCFAPIPFLAPAPAPAALLQTNQPQGPGGLCRSPRGGAGPRRPHPALRCERRGWSGEPYDATPAPRPLQPARRLQLLARRPAAALTSPSERVESAAAG